mgnify:CR=1 FL=1
MKGFSILELSLVIAILIFIFFSLVYLILNVSNFNSYFIFGLGYYQDAALFLKEIEKELKSMEDSSIGGYPLENTGRQRLTFYSDIDRDNYLERISYFIENNVLKKEIISPIGSPLRYDPSTAKIKTIISDLPMPQDIFYYYDKNFNPTNDISKIRIIKVNIKIFTSSQKNNFFENYILVTPRNLKER